MIDCAPATLTQASRTNSARNMPWKKFDQPVRAPLLTLAEERTISAIIGRPPMELARRLPKPTAVRSRFRSEC